MFTLVDCMTAYISTTFAHALLVVYLFAIMDERSWRRLKKLPALLLSSLVTCTLNVLLFALRTETLIRFCAGSLIALLGLSLIHI